MKDIIRIIDFVLSLAILYSTYSDLKYKKIYNYITLPTIIIGITIHFLNTGFDGLLFSISGMALGYAVFILPFYFGGMGSGDVKLMAAIGALKGWRFVLLATIYSGLVGGIIIIIILIKQKKLLITLKRVLAIILKPVMFVLTITVENKKLKQFNNWLLNSQINWEKQYIPYGVAIGIGAIMALLI